MIIVDTGPLIALFDPQDHYHKKSKQILSRIHESLTTTEPVLTEAFYMLNGPSIGTKRLIDFIVRGGMTVTHLTNERLIRAFELIDTYQKVEMELADASVIVAAEVHKTLKIFTFDNRDFHQYKVRKGHRHYAIEMMS